jgi:hypothetical protein
VLRPNFTAISWEESGDLRVKGRSDPDEVSHIRGIVITLSQKHDRGAPTISRPVIVETVPNSGDWNAIVAGDGFDAGPVAALGMETHDNATLITWADALDIPKEP